MKFIIKFLFFLLIVFSLNILFYFISADYRFFLEKLKYNDEPVYLDNNKINDEYVKTEKIENEELLKVEELPKVKEIKENNTSSISDNIIKELTQVKKEVVLGNNYKDILNNFEEKYFLKKIEVNSTLFELTDEFPDYYFEYYSKDLTLYLFPTKTYSEIYDIFEYLQNDSPFNINEINNFGEKSFYINLNEDIDDKYIRIVISKNGITFGLKVKKDKYNEVKEILLKLK